jgi:acetylornithine deacetylase/succinyl-diaminopimelate desuccinylase-like protein
MRKSIFVFVLLISFFCTAQDNVQLKSQVRHTIDELRDFIAIPNDALDHANINRNITWLTEKFNERGFNTSVLPTEGESLFFAALPIEDAKPTILFYMHFDGQSVDPSKWDQPDPYKVVLKAPEGEGWKDLSFSDLSDDIDYDWRLFGRSTSDDKGPIVMFLNAIDMLRKNNQEIPVNVKVILDGQEEKGSEPLPKAVKDYRELLEADFLLIADGPVHPSGKPTVVYGCRGITELTLTTYGPVKPQHSGHYGNYAPNPGFLLAELLASMKDPDGRVVIDGYYDGIQLEENSLAILRSVPDDSLTINSYLGIKTPEKVGAFYQESLQYPSLNIRGMSSGWVGNEVRTIVPDQAMAEIDIRLVPETKGERMKALVKEHIKKQGYHIVGEEPRMEERLAHDRLIKVTEGGVTNAFRTSLDNPYGQQLVGILQDAFGEEVVQIRIAGGTVPIAPFVNELNVPAFLVPMVNPDNNQHSPNENLKIGQIAYGIKVFYRVLQSEWKS